MNEQRIDKLTRILQSVSTMGGEAETTKIVTNLEVTDATPPVTTVPAGYIIVENDQGFNVPAQEVPGVSYADGDLVNVLYVKGSEPVAMQQGSSSPSSNLWEIVPATTTDIFYDGGLVGINNPTPAENLDVLGSVVVDTNVFYIDDVNDFVGFGIIVSNTSQQIFVLMDANKDILIDGTTNPRNVDTGVMRFEQTPAITDTRALTVNMDINSQVNSHALVVNLVATQLQAGESVSAYDINIDTANASGGIVRGFEVSCAGAGTVDGCHALHVDPNVSPIFHLSGSFISVEQAWQDDGGFIDTTAAFNGAPDINIFVNNGAVCYWGMAATFDQIEVVLNIVASGPGIKPTFEFSDGIGGWTVFTPSDESQGFRQNGIISWTITDLVGWAVDTVNAVANKYWIRITRTQVALTTPPNEETLLVAATTEYSWDEDAVATINNLVVEDAITHRDDADNKIAFTDDIQTFTVGGEVLLTLTEAGQDVVKIGDGGDVDINFNDMMLLEGSSGKFGIGTPTPARQFTIKSPDAPAANTVVLQVEDNAGVMRTQILNTGAQIWQLHSTAVEVGQIAYSTPAGSPALLISTGTPGAYVNRFDFANNATNLTLKYNADSFGIRIASGGNVSIGTVSALARLHVDQSSMTATIPVLSLDQADLSEEFINFITTIGAGNPIDTATIGTYYGKARVAVNGTFKYVPLHNS